MTKFEIEEKIVAMLKTVFDPEIPVNVRLGIHLQNRCCRQRRRNHRHDPDGSQLPRRRLHHGGCPPEDRIDRRSEFRHHQPGVRTRMGQGHDERRSQTGIGFSLTNNGTVYK